MSSPVTYGYGSGTARHPLDRHDRNKSASLRLARSHSRERTQVDAKTGDGDDGDLRSWTGFLSHRGSLNDLNESVSVFNKPLSQEPDSLASANESDPLSPILPRSQSVSRPDQLTWRQKLFRLGPLTGVQRRILKCSIAYFCASLFTFVDPLSDIVSDFFDLDVPVSNAHFVATIATYFNPGKTSGQMIEADLFLLWAAIFSLVVCYGSMGTAVGLNLENVEWLSHLVVVVFWLSGSMAIIAFVKNRVNKATFGSACSMTALINSVIICREGAIHLKIFESDAITQMSLIVFIGAAISNVVCFLLWPESSTTKLQDNVSKTLDAFAELIQLISRTFLLDDDAPFRDDRVVKSAVDTHQASFTALKDSLDAAKLELLNPHISGSHDAYDSIVASMTRLAQHTSGLRSGCSLQNRLQQARRDGTLNWPLPDEPFEAKTGVHELDARLRDAALTFAAFERHVGPSLRKLTAECKEAFQELRISFSSSRRPDDTNGDLEEGSSLAILEKIKKELSDALSAFERDHSRALKRLYKNHPSRMPTGSDARAALEDSIRPALDISKANEDIFELYFFLFNLEELVHELIHLVDAFVVIRAREDQLEALETARRRRYGRYANVAASFGIGGSLRVSATLRHKLSVLFSRFAALMPFGQSASPFPPTKDVKSEWSQRQVLPFHERCQRALWQWLQRQKNPDVLFAVKVGVGAGMLGAPAFLEATRDTWVRYRGEWAMISYMVVVATTVGQTQFNLFFRIIGTIFGALVAILAYHTMSHLPALLAVFGFFFSLPCFWLVITKPRFATTGRFILLAYNLTALYAYNMREEDLRITLVAFHRSLAVAVGSIWAWVVTTLVWRYEARNELRSGLSELLLHYAWLYEKLVAAYSTPPKELTRSVPAKHSNSNNGTVNETSFLLSPAARRHISSTIESFVELELHLQRHIIGLKSLLSAARLEWRLSGPFPERLYGRQIESAQAMLDLLHAMRCVTTREAWYTTVRREFVIPVQDERRHMVGSVILYLSILASSISLESPLPPFMPPAEDARCRLMDAIRALPVVKNRVVHRADSLLYFAYASVMEDVIRELETMGSCCRDLFGVPGNRDAGDFERLFTWQDEEAAETASVASSSSED